MQYLNPTYMKLERLKETALLVSLSALLVMCTDNDNKMKTEELSSFAKEYLGMRLGAQDAMKSSQAGAINNSFNTLMKNFQVIGNARTMGDSTTETKPEPGDSAIYGEPWVSCATITETHNNDGSVTTVTDYGTGCDEGWDEWKYRTWGKITSTYLYTNKISGASMINDYSYSSRYDNYGGKYYSDSSEWGMNGMSDYSGESVYDTTGLSFSGWYQYADDMSYYWNKDNYKYKGSGRTNYDSKQWVTESADYEYTSDSNYYRSLVTKPLVMDYTCTPPMMYLEGVKTESDDANIIYVFTYVSGIEEITYRKGTEQGQFTIDYGDGECDNIITVTENGTSVTVDLGNYLKTGYTDGGTITVSSSNGGDATSK
jgi:hypothetical protein